MIKIKSIVFFSLLVLLISCNLSNNNNAYYRAGIRFLSNLRTFEKKHDLKLASYGVNTDGNMYTPPRSAIHQFDLMFFSSERLNLDEARKKFVICVEDFLNDVNKSELLNGCLYDPPFTSKNLNFSIFFHDDKGNNIIDNYVSHCSLFDNNILFVGEFSDDSVTLFYKEPYEVSRIIVENNIQTDIKIKKSESRQPGIPNYGKDDEEEKRSLEKLKKQLQKYNISNGKF